MYSDRVPLAPKKEKIFSFLRDRKIKNKNKKKNLKINLAIDKFH